LFAGIGGFRLGLEELREEGLHGESVLASEINVWAKTLYELNFRGEETVGNILHLPSSTMPHHDLLTAGFPCQPFTEKGAEKQERGFRDARGQLFWHVVRLVKASQPRAVLLENVPGLLKNDMRREREHANQGLREGAPGSAIEAVLSALSMCGYAVSYRVYNAMHWVPQIRERLFIVGIRNDITHDPLKPPFVWPACPTETPPPTIKSILQDAEGDIDLEPYRLKPKEWEEISKSTYFKQHPANRCPDIDSSANTLRSSYRSGFKLYSQFVPIQKKESEGQDGVGVRFFTPRECARLQGFPDTFKLTAATPEEPKVPEHAQYQAVGNAVAPPVVTAVARAVLAAVM